MKEGEIKGSGRLMLREKDEINSFLHEKRVKKYGKKAQ